MRLLDCMLPLHQNGLSSASDWHELKTLLVLAKHAPENRTRQALQTLNLNLHAHSAAKAVARFLDCGDTLTLDIAAAKLADRELNDAWTLLERM